MTERAVRYENWKLLVNHAKSASKQEPARAESVELFHLAEDPNEKSRAR